MKWFLIGMQKWATFSGRANRQEYWMFVLVLLGLSLLIGFVCGVLQGLTGIRFEVAATLFDLATLVPTFSIAARRMHDIDRSAWWMLVPIVGFVYLFYKGTPGDNRFGPESHPVDPRGEL